MAHHISAKHIESWHAFQNDTCPIDLTIAPIDAPLYLPENKLVMITESQLFGHQVMQTRLRKKRAIDPDTMIKSLAELQISAPVVHIDHGIGKYIGLEKIMTDGIESEYVTLAYSGDDRIYVPIHALHLIHRYTGADSDHVVLNKLGTNQWEKAKQKAAKKIRDVAAELLLASGIKYLF